MNTLSHIGFVATEAAGLYQTHRPVSSDEILTMANRLIRRKFARGRGDDQSLRRRRVSACPNGGV
jgi:DNA repair protein RadC